MEACSETGKITGNSSVWVCPLPSRHHQDMVNATLWPCSQQTSFLLLPVQRPFSPASFTFLKKKKQKKTTFIIPGFTPGRSCNKEIQKNLMLPGGRGHEWASQKTPIVEMLCPQSGPAPTTDRQKSSSRIAGPWGASLLRGLPFENDGRAVGAECGSASCMVSAGRWGVLASGDPNQAGMAGMAVQEGLHWPSKEGLSSTAVCHFFSVFS